MHVRSREKQALDKRKMSKVKVVHEFVSVSDWLIVKETLN